MHTNNNKPQEDNLRNEPPTRQNDIEVIYDAITNLDKCLDDYIILDKYGIQKGEYYYTVSSMLPHKNLITLIKVIAPFTFFH